MTELVARAELLVIAELVASAALLEDCMVEL